MSQTKQTKAAGGAISVRTKTSGDNREDERVYTAPKQRYLDYSEDSDEGFTRVTRVQKKSFRTRFEGPMEDEVYTRIRGISRDADQDWKHLPNWIWDLVRSDVKNNRPTDRKAIVSTFAMSRLRQDKIRALRQQQKSVVERKQGSEIMTKPKVRTSREVDEIVSYSQSVMGKATEKLREATNTSRVLDERQNTKTQIGQLMRDRCARLGLELAQDDDSYLNGLLDGLLLATCKSRTITPSETRPSTPSIGVDTVDECTASVSSGFDGTEGINRVPTTVKMVDKECGWLQVSYGGNNYIDLVPPVWAGAAGSLMEQLSQQHPLVDVFEDGGEMYGAKRHKCTVTYVDDVFVGCASNKRFARSYALAGVILHHYPETVTCSTIGEVRSIVIKKIRQEREAEDARRDTEINELRGIITSMQGDVLTMTGRVNRENDVLKEPKTVLVNGEVIKSLVNV